MTDITAKRDAGRPETKASEGGQDPVPATVDWVLGAIAGVVGVALVAVGTWMYARVDRAMIADSVTAESTDVNGLTNAEAIAAGVPFVDWLSVGIAATGAGLVAAAALFVRARRQTRRRVASEGGTTATFWASATYGAAVAALVSFIPGAGAVGGGLAAHLHEGGSSTRVGGAAGLVGWAVTVPLAAFVAIGLLAGASAIDMLGGGVVLAGLVVGSGLLGLAVNVGLGALGGYVVDRL